MTAQEKAAAWAEEGLRLYRSDDPDECRRGVERFQQACDGGLRRACAQAASAKAEGRCVPADPRGAAGCLSSLCHLDVGLACLNLSRMTAAGIGVSRSPPHAQILLRRACKLGEARACLDMAETALKSGDVDAARTAFLAACDAGHGLACVAAADLMAQGRGGPLDLDGALIRVQKACDEGTREACAAQAELLYRGLPPDRRDPLRAFALFTVACEAGHMASCNACGALLLSGDAALPAAQDPAAPTRARELFQRACDGGDAPACHNLGLLWKNGVGVPADPGAAREWFARACRLGDESACPFAQEE